VLEEIVNCLKVEDECIKLNSETKCLTKGVVMIGQEELGCFWLLGNTSTTAQTTSQCILKVWN
jgi:hypothetical protein